MFLAFAVLLFAPQAPSRPSIDIAKLDASAAASSPVVPGDYTAAATTPASESISSSSSSPAAAPAPAAYEPGMLTPVPVAATESSSIVAAAAPASAGTIHPFKAMVLSVINPQFENRRDQRMWMALSIAQHTAAGFDSWSTRREISSGQAHEDNPFLKPFAGNYSLYVVMQITPFALDYVARRMMYSSHRWERRTWWVPQVLGTASSFAAGGHNLTVRATPAP
jgi:hypothetical protein